MPHTVSPLAGSVSIPAGEVAPSRGRTDAPTSSQPGSRSTSRARDLLNKLTHQSAGTDWATQSFANAPASAGSRSATPSREASPSRASGSRSSSRAREFIHKLAHQGPGTDWAAASLSGASPGPDGGEERTGRTSRGASPAAGSRSASRSTSRVREVLHKLGSMGPGTDWAAHSLAGATKATDTPVGTGVTKATDTPVGTAAAEEPTNVV